jgi:hypothetical protein
VNAPCLKSALAVTFADRLRAFHKDLKEPRRERERCNRIPLGGGQYMKRGGGIALGFTPYSGQPNEALPETLIASGFTKAHVVETDKGFCALATKL